jgi:hypothetical protein
MPRDRAPELHKALFRGLDQIQQARPLIRRQRNQLLDTSGIARCVIEYHPQVEKRPQESCVHRFSNDASRFFCFYARPSTSAAVRASVRCGKPDPPNQPVAHFIEPVHATLREAATFDRVARVAGGQRGVRVERTTRAR